jgi:hypothetical protein
MRRLAPAAAVALVLVLAAALYRAERELEMLGRQADAFAFPCE